MIASMASTPAPPAKTSEESPKTAAKRRAKKPNGEKAEKAEKSSTAPPRAGKATATATSKRAPREKPASIVVKRIHRRDLNRVWEFLKLSFRDVNRATVEYQRPRTKQRFFETYEEEGVEQLLFMVKSEIVAYAEVTYEILGQDTWLNPRYFEKRDMRPLYVEELAVHPDYAGRGIGSFVLEQLDHLAKLRGLTHLVLEVAENNENALAWYRKRNFRKLDAAIFMAKSVDVPDELLPPRPLPPPREEPEEESKG
jgi:ribosomal protein S18 acetylase RimI-like enzyme